MKPEMAQDIVNVEHTIMAASGGVQDGDQVGNDYNSDDVTYGDSNGSLWDDED